jgi:hypothetical protein
MTRLLVGLVIDLGVGGVALDRLDAADRARTALIGLASGDHLIVGATGLKRYLPVEPFLSTNLAVMRPPRGRRLFARVVSNRPYLRPASAVVRLGDAGRALLTRNGLGQQPGVTMPAA